MSNLHIVIARYNESLDWLNTCLTPHQRRAVWIYNKGPDSVSIDGVPDSQIQNLPNVGREAHTYLTHIIQQWDKLPKHVYFLQADPFPHIEIQDTFDSVQTWFERWTDQIINRGFSQNVNWDVHANDFHEPFTEQTPWTFGEWLEKNTGKKFGYPLMWFIGACFGCSRNQIKYRTREYYEGLRDQLMTVKPEVAYYLERAWFYVFQL
jgi:hypothetical protein